MKLQFKGNLSGSVPVESMVICEQMQNAFETMARLHTGLNLCKVKSLQATKTEAAEAIQSLRGFIGRSQLSAIASACRGEECQFFFDKLVEMAALVHFMPKTYDQDGKGDEALVTLHYFTGGCDWWITEKDMLEEQHQAFGLADLGQGHRELGYISLVEILQAGAELDLYFTPRTLAAVKAKDTTE